MAQLLHLYCHSEIQNGGCKWRLFFEKLEKNNNPDCMQDSCIISTVLPIFSWSRNSMMLLSILCGASGSPKSKMAVLKEEILYFSICMQHSCKIPTAKLMFSRLTNSMKIFSILCDAGGSQKFKMAAHKPEMLISRTVFHYWKIPKATPILPRSLDSKKLFIILCDVSGSRKSKMAALKEEILIAQQIYNIVAKFLRL